MKSSNLSRDEAAQRSRQLKVHSYSVVVDVSRAPERELDTFAVDSTVVFDSTEPQTWLDFLDGMVEQVWINDEPTDAKLDGARIALAGLRTDAPNTVRVLGRGTYSRSGQGLHRFHDPEDGRTYLYTQYEPADSRRVFPNFEQPDLKAVFEFSVLAPKGWVVLSNKPARVVEEQQVDGAEPLELHVFEPTERQSTYLTAICAGEYDTIDGGVWTSPAGLEVPLRLFVRKSLARYLDSDNVLQVTRQGMDWYDANFGFPYPWGKYDQIFVPEYNLGAMENPGCVTFTEGYIHRSPGTRAEYQARANTILHEMAHMWFGDLVTPAWWDDLWLKESFAEFMGAHVSVEATEFEQAWVAFAGRRKAWAYSQDQLPTTHPIVADITDLESAAQNFDGITYAKGAAVLRQLVAHVGTEAFLAGSRAYFKAHAFDSARLADLLKALEEASGRDLSSWSHAWLQTAGPDTLMPVVEVADGKLVRLAIEQHSSDARDGATVGRPHTLKVGLYELQGEALVRTDLVDVELDGSPVHELPELAGRPAPALVLVNDTDLTYAKIGLDETSLATVGEHLSGLADPLARALVWSSLWNMCRDAQLRVEDYIAIVMAHAGSETDSATLIELLANCWFGLTHYVDDEHRPALQALHAKGLLDGLAAAEPGSDAQLVWARAVASAAVLETELLERVEAQFDEATRTPGLVFGRPLRWDHVVALAAQGRIDQTRIDAELAEDPSSAGQTNALRARTSLPDAAIKAEAWASVHQPRAHSNDHVDAMVWALNLPGQKQLTAGLREGWYDTLEGTWSAHSLEIAQRLVRGFFPSDPAQAQHAEAWLAAHPEVPRAMRRLLLEGQDHIRREQAAQQFNR